MSSHTATADLADLLTFWVGFENELRTLAFYAVGIAIYGLFIYFFYNNLSQRNLLGERFQNPGVGVGKAILRGIRYLLVFPAVSFAFFVLLAFSFFFLSGRSSQADFDQILLISMAVVTSVRITAYVSPPTSHDIAKLLPLGLLGVYLVNFNLQADVLRTSVENFQSFLDTATLTDVVSRYLIFLVLLESVLRIIYLVVRPGGPEKPGVQTAPGEEGRPDAAGTGRPFTEAPAGRGGRPGSKGPRPGRTPQDRRPPGGGDGSG